MPGMARRQLLAALTVSAAAVVVAALPASGVAAGVGGGASSLSFGQGTPSYGYGLTVTTNRAVTSLYEISWSCRSAKTGENDFSYASAGLKIHRLRYSGAITFTHQEFSNTLDTLATLAPVRGYVKLRWKNATGPLTGTMRAKGCRNGTPQKVNAVIG